MELTTSNDLRKQIQTRVNDSSVDETAEYLKITTAYLYMILSGTRDVSKDVAQRLGYVKVSTPRPQPVFAPIENTLPN